MTCPECKGDVKSLHTSWRNFEFNGERCPVCANNAVKVLLKEQEKQHKEH